MVLKVSSMWGSNPCVIMCVVLTSFVATCSGLQAQEQQRNPDFKVAISQSLGFGGFETTGQFMLVDEFGFRYDPTILLANSSVKDSIDLTSEQIEEISTNWQSAKKEMTAMLIGAIASDDKKAQIEAVFYESQATLLSLLDQEQQEQLEVAAGRLAIEQYGVDKYIQTKRVQEKLGLTSDQIETVAAVQAEDAKRLKVVLSDLIRRSNLALIEKLTDTQQQELKATLGEKSYDKFLETKLFANEELATSDASAANTKENRSEVFKACLIGKVRRGADIDSEQYDQVRKFCRPALKLKTAEFESELSRILTSNQVDTLQKLALEKQTKNLGTVNSTSHGVLASKLGIDEKQAEDLFSFGKELQEDFDSEVREIKKQALVQTFKALSQGQVERLSKVIDAAGSKAFVR